ncbi:hypothetical protein VFPFJ_03196 [Purpureocillium lilacinum]|uniref:Uncharacterized protein n=1 Tax=Purpureocillium lilacinum TaxID=33203 RepID=A0A179HM08_PURLI|nr:hypothetical protein VFPFJ_03196 [Purpureocillium lilacinum]OAQ91456.1 hypothetical protein VFPFJ_03196 [Purpureocillium lilacinum]
MLSTDGVGRLRKTTSHMSRAGEPGGEVLEDGQAAAGLGVDSGVAGEAQVSRPAVDGVERRNGILGSPQRGSSICSRLAHQGQMAAGPAGRRFRRARGCGPARRCSPPRTRRPRAVTGSVLVGAVALLVPEGAPHTHRLAMATGDLATAAWIAGLRPAVGPPGESVVRTHAHPSAASE